MIAFFCGDTMSYINGYFLLHEYLYLFPFQIFCQFCHGSGPMTDTILDFLAQLGKALVVAFRDEDGVVAEAFGAVFLSGNTAVHDALKLVDLLDAGATAGTHVLLLDVADDGAEAGFSVLFSV